MDSLPTSVRRAAIVALIAVGTIGAAPPEQQLTAAERLATVQVTATAQNDASLSLVNAS